MQCRPLLERAPDDGTQPNRTPCCPAKINVGLHRVILCDWGTVHGVGSALEAGITSLSDTHQLGCVGREHEWGNVTMTRNLRRWHGSVGAAVLVLTLSFGVMPASAGGHTIVMTTSDSCRYDCTIVVMQVKGSKVRFKNRYAQSGGIYSIGWMTRQGNQVKGLVGYGDCGKHTETRTVVGRGDSTHFTGMHVTSKGQARAFARRHPNLGLGIPTWPWTSLKRWKAGYKKFCE